MKTRSPILILAAVFLFFAAVPSPAAESPPPAAPAKAGGISAEEYDPAAWGEFYPREYDSWKKTQEPRPAGRSRYKRGWDTDKIVYDKLSEYPFLALLYNGWGFGVEYNEPRGHWYMLVDQQEVDPSRVKAGGICLTCKTPYSENLLAERKPELLKASYADAVKMLPERHRTLGVACVDCHDPAGAGLRVRRTALQKGLTAIGKASWTRDELRSLVCAQCHVTYILTRDAAMKPTDVVFPWQGGGWGNIPVERIIAQINSSPANLEWKQAVTGFTLGAIRHPEFEFYSRGSPHWENGVACADCHMPMEKLKGTEIADHNIMSPLKNGMRACAACHDDGPEKRKEAVLAIQDQTADALNRAGYAVAAVAKLFDAANRAKDGGKTLDAGLYGQARAEYLEAYYRVNFLAAENSVGFHNPSEAERILKDAAASAAKADGLLRDALAKAGVMVPEKVDLELARYLNDRGSKKLAFKPEQEFKPAP